MSDPANFGILQYSGKKKPDGTSEESGIMWIHMPNGGEGMANRLATALQDSQERWDDSGFVNAQIIAAVGRESKLGGVTFNKLQENEHTLHIVDFVQRKVYLMADWDGAHDSEKRPKAKMAFPIETYISKFKK